MALATFESAPAPIYYQRPRLTPDQRDIFRAVYSEDSSVGQLVLLAHTIARENDISRREAALLMRDAALSIIEVLPELSVIETDTIFTITASFFWLKYDFSLARPPLAKLRPLCYVFLMAAKNSVKEFVPDAYYHLYNRGVEKRTIFLDEQDRVVFLSYLKTYLLPKDKDSLRAILANPESSSREKDAALKALRLNNFADTFTLLTYCLMPNHFHFLVKQTEATTIDQFMNSFGVRYCTYFNRKYRRVGGLFQGVYKAVRVTSGEQLLHLSRYIHRNPIASASQDHLLRSYAYSSYPQYLGLTQADWLHPEDILDYFPKTQKRGYQEFVEGPSSGDAAMMVAKLTIDNDD